MVCDAFGHAIEAWWRGRRVSTAPADRAAAEEGVRLVYRKGGLRPPRIAWHDGPASLATSRAAALPCAGATVKDAVIATPHREVMQRLALHTDRRVTLVHDRFDHDCTGVVGAAMCAAVIEAAACPSLGAWLHHFRSVLANRCWPPSFAASGSSQHELCRLGFTAALLEMLEPRTASEEQGLGLVAANAGWIVPHSHVCWLSDRPVELSFDHLGRLHSSSGPALRYSDGWSVYAWKGTPVPSWVIIEPQTLSLAWIDAQIDPLVRRAMIDIFTPGRFVDTGGAACVVRDARGTLWIRKWSYRGAVIDSWAAVELPTREGARSFRCVPGHVSTPGEALAWLQGLPERSSISWIPRSTGTAQPLG